MPDNACSVTLEEYIDHALFLCAGSSFTVGIADEEPCNPKVCTAPHQSISTSQPSCLVLFTSCLPSHSLLTSCLPSQGPLMSCRPRLSRRPRWLSHQSLDPPQLSPKCPQIFFYYTSSCECRYHRNLSFPRIYDMFGLFVYRFFVSDVFTRNTTTGFVTGLLVCCESSLGTTETVSHG